MKLLFPLVATAFVGGAGASIYYSVKSGSNDQNKGSKEADLNGEEPEKLEVPQGLETKKKEKNHEDPHVPDPHKIPAQPESERIESRDGREVHVVERTLF